MKRFAVLAALALMGPLAAQAADDAAGDACKDKLGVARVAEVDTTGGPEFGEQYPPTQLLQKGEVALTFDDGPHPTFTREVLDALKAQCTKATFFHVGRMVKLLPDIAKQVQAEGHTVGTHTWSHANLGALSLERAKLQIEVANTLENGILPDGIAPFFRFHYLSDPKRVREYLATRNIGIFGIDVDSSDYRTRKPEQVHANVMKGLANKGGGIILFHDIHASTAKALPGLLEEIRKKGFKVVHLVPKSKIEVLAVAELPPEKVTRQKRRTRRQARR